MSRRWSIEPEVEDELRALLAVGYSPARALQRLASNERYRERLPSLRTAQRMAREVPAANGARWSMATADPDEARLVLPVLATLTSEVGGLSAETAEWVVRIRLAAPGLAPYDAFLWALRYQAAVTAGRPTLELDRRLAEALTAPRSHR